MFFIFCMHFLFSVGNICSIFFLYISWGFCHVNYWGGRCFFFQEETKYESDTYDGKDDKDHLVFWGA